MNAKEISDILEYERAGEALSKLYESLHTGRASTQMYLQEKYEPLLKPLNKLVENTAPTTDTTNAIITPVVNKRQNTGILGNKFESTPKDVYAIDKNGKIFSEFENDTDSADSFSTTTAPTVYDNQEINDESIATEDDSDDSDTSVNLDDTLTLNFEKAFSELGDIGSTYKQLYADDYVPNKRKSAYIIDRSYGIRVAGDKAYFGREPIYANDGHIILGDKGHYPQTRGLWQLLFLAKPDSSVYLSLIHI